MWTSPPPPRDNALVRAYKEVRSTISSITSLPPSTIDIILPSIAAAGGALTFVYVYRNTLKRYPDSNSLPPHFFRRKTLYGKVVSVGDADNFRLFHTPGGKWLGWEWFPGRKVPEGKRTLKGQTIHIRIAGVDAPEGSHFGKPSQPHSSESLAYLSALLTTRYVRASLLRRDQYERVVCSVSMKRRGILGLLGLRQDVGLLMLKEGMAQVYEGTYGIEFGKREGMEKIYRDAEEEARSKKIGIWGLKGAYESPGQYKARTATKDGGMFTQSVPEKLSGEKVKGKRGVSSKSINSRDDPSEAKESTKKRGRPPASEPVSIPKKRKKDDTS